MSLPTLDDLKTHANITGTQDDAELLDHLYAAIDVVESIVGPLRDGEVTETHRGVNTDVLILRSTPVGTLVDVSTRLYPGYDMSAGTLVDYELDTASGLLRLASGGYFRGDVRVTYRTGRDYLPASVRLAILIIGKSLWETQRGAQPLPLQGSDEGTVNTSYAPAIPARAATLLEPYARGGQVA
jgi:hypothetical protein